MTGIANEELLNPSIIDSVFPILPDTTKILKTKAISQQIHTFAIRTLYFYSTSRTQQVRM